VLRFADGLQRQPAVRQVRTPDRTRETRWVRDNRSAYADQWVAVEGDRLIAAGLDAREVFAAAKAARIESPFVVHIPPEDSLPFVPGW
jgi:hypothetical protein